MRSRREAVGVNSAIAGLSRGAVSDSLAAADRLYDAPPLARPFLAQRVQSDRGGYSNPAIAMEQRKAFQFTDDEPPPSGVDSTGDNLQTVYGARKAAGWTLESMSDMSAG